MRTDTLFYQLFQTFHGLLFELIDEPASNAEGYDFVSVEVKEKAFRFDGIFLAADVEKPIYFVEVQFQKNPDFYWSFVGEIFLYLSQYKPLQDWKAVAVFADRNLDEGIPRQFHELFVSQRIRCVYLDTLRDRSDNSLEVGIVELIIADEAVTLDMARDLVRELRNREREATVSQKTVELVVDVLLNKFNNLSRKEIETMLTFDELKQSRLFQELAADYSREVRLEARLEGKKIGEKIGEKRGEKRGEIKGKLQGKQESVLRVLKRRFKRVSAESRAKISRLPESKLDDLIDAIFDFKSVADLTAWLKVHGGDR
jgi:predicted transposase/invertase (TIGR01784 family)